MFQSVDPAWPTATASAGDAMCLRGAHLFFCRSRRQYRRLLSAILVGDSHRASPSLEATLLLKDDAIL